MVNLIAVEQHGFAVFGIGDTIDAAKADATEWLDKSDHGTESDLAAADWNSRPNHGDLRLARITPELAAAVREHGGHLAYGTLPDGTLCTTEQQEEAYA